MQDGTIIDVSVGVGIDFVFEWGSKVTCFWYGGLRLTWFWSVENDLYVVLGSEVTWPIRRGIETDVVLEWGSKLTCVQPVVEIIFIFFYGVVNGVV